MNLSDYNFIGVGKIVLKTFDNEDYNIPHLHCIINKTEDGFEFINLEFGLVTFAENTEEALESLARMLIEYIKRTIDTLGFETLVEVVSKGVMNDFWTEYRKMEFSLAERKQDVGHRVIDAIKKEAIEEFIRQYGIEPDIKFSLFEEAA